MTTYLEKRIEEVMEKFRIRFYEEFTQNRDSLSMESVKSFLRTALSEMYEAGKEVGEHEGRIDEADKCNEHAEKEWNLALDAVGEKMPPEMTSKQWRESDEFTGCCGEEADGFNFLRSQLLKILQSLRK